MLWLELLDGGGGGGWSRSARARVDTVDEDRSGRLCLDVAVNAMPENLGVKSLVSHRYVADGISFWGGQNRKIPTDAAGQQQRQEDGTDHEASVSEGSP